MVTIISIAFLFIFGLVVGSFLNSVIYRLEKKESFLLYRSYCPHCRHILAWYDLIPILSFIMLKGRCRYCKKRISWQYPAVEIGTGILFVIFFIFSTAVHEIKTGRDFFVSTASLAYYWVIICFLIIIFVYDLKHYIIPDKVIWPGIGMAFVFVILSAAKDPVAPALTTGFFASLRMTILGAFGAAVFFGAIVLVSRGTWMGVGDIKLAFLMGLFLGWPNIAVALFSAFLLGAAVGLGLIIWGKETLKSQVPFGPFLVAGAFFALFFGQQVIHKYLSLFLW